MKMENIVNEFLESNPEVQRMFDEYVKHRKEEENKILYKWVCESDDGYFEDSEVDNGDTFTSQETAYEDMKDSAFYRAMDYVEYDDVIEDCGSYENKESELTETEDDMGVRCNLECHPHKIILERGGCMYEYKIVRIEKNGRA